MNKLFSSFTIAPSRPPLSEDSGRAARRTRGVSGCDWSTAYGRYMSIREQLTVTPTTTTSTTGGDPPVGYYTPPCRVGGGPPVLKDMWGAWGLKSLSTTKRCIVPRILIMNSTKDTHFLLLPVPLPSP